MEINATCCRECHVYLNVIKKEENVTVINK
jgi:hypothetical protein